MVNLHSCYVMVWSQLRIASRTALDYKYGTGIAMNAVRARKNKRLEQSKYSMDETVQKSCWGVTLWAVVGLAALILLAYLFSV